MRVARIYADDGGSSIIEDLEMPERTFRRGTLTASLDATSVVIRRAETVQPTDPHNAPARQLIAMLQGVVEIECTDGSRRRFGPGDVLLTDDTTGLGHVSRDVELPQASMVVVLSDDIDISSWKRLD